MKVASQCRRAQALLLRSFATSGIAGTSIGCAPPGFSALDPRALCSGNAVATSAVAFIGSEARRHEHSRLDLGHEGLPAVVPASASSTVEGGRAEKLVLRQLVAGRVHETILQSTPGGSVQRRVKCTDDTTLDLKFIRRKRSFSAAIRAQLVATFLPAGFPGTVAPGYFPYICWRALQQGSSSANGVLASSFLLYTVGLGQGAIPVAGAVNWVLKDGLGQAGTLLAARFMARSFDDNARGWYARGAMLLNLATMVEISTIFAPDYFLIMGATANSLKGLSWMAIGATSAAFNLALQRNNNIADIHARTTTQSITVSLLGTAAGAWLASEIGQSPLEALMAASVLSGMNMIAAFRTTKCVPLPSLNPVRSRILAGRFLDMFLASNKAPSNGDMAMLPSPVQVALIDPVDFLPRRMSRLLLQAIHPEAHKLEPPIIGTPLHQADCLSPEVLQMVMRVHANLGYMVFPMRGEMHVILRDTSKGHDFLEAILQAEMLTREVHGRWASAVGDHCSDPGQVVCKGPIPRQDLPIGELEGAIKASLRRTSNLGPLFRHELQRAGWCTQRLVLEGSTNRATW